MNIVMVTNTFTPHVGGVARSVQMFSAGYREQGHRVLVVAPEFKGQPADEQDVIRLPAIQNFNGSDFSVVLPNFGALTDRLDEFRPDIVHSHHPFLLGMTALRVARFRDIPLVFTHHTLYEHYTHYVPGDSALLRQFTIELTTRYANLSDQIFAPSESMRALFRKRGVRIPVEVVPTGVRTAAFTRGDRVGFRESQGIPSDAFVIGHLGRLAPEKNLQFLAEAVAGFLAAHDNAHFLVIGSGSAGALIKQVITSKGLGARLHSVGILDSDQALSAAYHAMDLFAFASKSETQGMVLTEAMAAGLPVVALDAPAVNEVMEHGVNGYLCREENREAFITGLSWVHDLDRQGRQELQEGARETARTYSLENSVQKALSVYEQLCQETHRQEAQGERWHGVPRILRAEWEMLASLAGAINMSLEEGRDRKRP